MSGQCRLILMERHLPAPPDLPGLHGQYEGLVVNRRQPVDVRPLVSVVIELAIAEGIQAETRPCRDAEIFKIDEVIMLGNGVEIVPITAVNGRKVGQGHVGPITKRLQDAFSKLVRAGEVEMG